MSTSAAHELTARDDLGPGVLVGPDVQIGDDVQFGAYVVVHGGTKIGSGSVIGDHAVLGKQVRLASSSTASREPLDPLVIGEACTIGAHAVLNAGSTIGRLSFVGDQAMVRERVTIGERCVLGRSALVENDTTLGDRVKVQANAYLTAYMTLEDDVFIAPCVMTTNDNFMGRTEERFQHIGGPVIRRGARIGGGATLCPGVEIGEEAFIGAGAVVTKDVEPRKLMVGSPARALRDVPAEQLLDA
ncbi:MAG: N-acetyltransferase [Thermoleophilia bacterium]|nr:N-acetyltransferase [Thermoleophilia bacterium]